MEDALRIDYCDVGPFWSAPFKLVYICRSCIYYSVLYIIRKPKEKVLWKYKLYEHYLRTSEMRESRT